MSELNAEQMQKKRGLEICATARLRCKDCTIPSCLEKHLENALSLINELTEENERLGNRITCQVVLPDGKLEEIKNECLERVELDIKAIQADTVRKMQERLKEHLEKPEFPWDSFTVAEEVIDQIAKEMLEDER